MIHVGLNLFFDSLAFRSISRVLTIVLVGVGAELFGGMLSRPLFLAMARRHWFRRHILIIGTGRRAHYLRDLFRRSDRRLAELHFLTETYLGGSPPAGIPGEPIKPLSDVATVEELEARLHIDQVVVAVDDPTDLHFDHLLPWKANGVPVFDFNTFVERETGRVDLKWTESHWLLYSDGFRFGWLDRALKRMLDIVVSLSLLLLTLPTLAIIAVAIVFEDFGPVFYRQERVSQGGRTFRIIKFRTMRVDAEKHGAQWACRNDPRVTYVGRILRRTRIDEVPQLVNVLIGQMSMVGPRPERPVFVNELSEHIRLYHLRHSVKAGVTGWAQINYPYGASVEDAERKLEYDLFYLKHFSVLRDLSIMLQTFRVLVFAQGSR
jgi:sugar transferase (PEP-CTERM system associated)